MTESDSGNAGSSTPGDSSRRGPSPSAPIRGVGEGSRVPMTVEAVYWEDEDAADVSFVQMGRILLENRKLLLGLPLLFALVIVGVAFLSPRTWSSTASFMAQGGRSGQISRLSGLASQFGINVPTQEAGESPQFYADLVRSRDLLTRAVKTRYSFPDGDASTGVPQDSLSGTLVDFFDVESRDADSGVERGVRELRSRVAVSTRAETGVVQLSVTTQWPELSKRVAARIVGLVNQFNLETRRSQAEEEREFLESRLREAREELYAAEDSLRTFLERNRQFETSPILRFEQRRLQRQVDLEQQVYNALSSSYEEAKIAEVRNTPVITVVDAPEMPALPNPRRLVIKGVIGLLIGGIIASTWAFARELLMSSKEENPEDYAEFSRVRDEAAADVRGVWQALRHLVFGLRSRDDRRPKRG